MKKLLYLVVPAILLAGLIAWRLNQDIATKQAIGKAAQARKNMPLSVQVGTAHYTDLVSTYQAVGGAQSEFNVSIASKTAGRIDYLQARPGDHVTAGEVLVRIDPSEIQAQVAADRSAVAEAEQRLAQAQITANPTNVGVTTGIRQQQAAVATAQANLNQARQNGIQQVAAAHSAVVDAQGKLASAQAALANAQAGVNSAQANLNDATAKYNRTYTLYKQGYVAAQDVDDARTQVSVNQAGVSVANGQVRAAQSGVQSAQAQLRSAEDQERIAQTTAKTAVASATQQEKQAVAAYQLALANRAQTPAYTANLAALRDAVTAAQGTLQNAEAQLTNTVLRSPIDGYVDQRNADPGATASIGQTLLTVVQWSPLYMTAFIPEEIISDVPIGKHGIAVFDAIPDQTFDGVVTQESPSADPQSRQFTVYITLDNRKLLIKPGMFGRVTFVTQRVPHALVVPREAIQHGKQGDFVMVVTPEKTAHMAPVKAGPQFGANVQILSGLQPGDHVITLSVQPPREGQKVRIEPAAAGNNGDGGETGASTGGGGGSSTAGVGAGGATGGRAAGGGSAPAGGASSGR